VIPEVCYLLSIGAQTHVEVDFLRALIGSRLTIEHVEHADIDRMSELVETYGDFPLGTVDACVVAVAERLGVAQIATLDHRHFSVVRPMHVDAF
jgi:predicted nucleic acid-binding protein